MTVIEQVDGRTVIMEFSNNVIIPCICETNNRSTFSLVQVDDSVAHGPFNIGLAEDLLAGNAEKMQLL